MISKSDLISKTGWNESLINESLERLSSYLLIEQKGENIRPLSIQEMFFNCQCKYDSSSPFIVKDGVISLKKDDGQG